MNGKVVAMAILGSAALAGAALYYLQVYGYYTEVQAEAGQDVMLLPLGSIT